MATSRGSCDSDPVQRGAISGHAFGGLTARPESGTADGEIHESLAREMRFVRRALLTSQGIGFLC